MPIDGYEDFFNKKNANKTVMNFLDFEKTKNSSNILEEPKVDIEETPVTLETPSETPVTSEEPISK